ncbi:MAG TPA: hypothetical protein VHO48_08535 [Anaerolineaceae bacterium]|nr:hypothetical protein [Anaerolineaceae bacterium]
MNLLYAVSWYYSGASDEARAFYLALRRGVAQGKSFPIPCPYEVALVHALPNPDSYWMVAVLALRNTPGDDSLDTTNRINDWFKECGAAGWEDKETRSARAVSVESELGSGYEVTDSFGTFVGEPNPGDPEPPAEAPEEHPTGPSEPPAIETAAPIALLPEPASAAAPITEPVTEPASPAQVTADLIGALGGAPRPQPAAPYAVPAPAAPQSGTRPNSCFGIGLTVLGVMLVIGGFGVGLLFLLGQIAGESENSFEDFLLAIACVPLPVVIAGAVLLALGVFLTRRARRTE